MYTPTTIRGKPYFYDRVLDGVLADIDEAIAKSWAKNELGPQLLLETYQQAKIDELYHSNRIEGNSLTYGESVDVVQANKEVRHRSLRDQQEARNLSQVLDYVYKIGGDRSVSVTQNELRRIHSLLMEGIQADAGTFRTTQTVIAGSRFSPPEAFEIPQHMTQLSDFIKHATDPEHSLDKGAIFACAAAHAWLAQIHPFSDGNGRSARALMNLILIRNRYLACIITEDDRSRYINALEESQGSDLTPLAELFAENVQESINDSQWLSSLVTRLESSTIDRVRDEYEIWHTAMDHLKSLFKLNVDNFNAMKTLSSVYVKFADYGPLSIEKYASMRDGGHARKTWFFGLEFNGDGRQARYLFDYGRPAQRMRNRAPVVLFVAKNTEYGYERVQYISQSNIPEIYQVGFHLDSRKYVAFGSSGIRERNPVNLVRQFFNEVTKRDFGA